MTTFTTQDRQDAQRDALTDEQIDLLAEKFWHDGAFDDGYLDTVEFARALLEMTKPQPLSQDKIWELANEWVEVKDQDGSKVVLFLDLFARAIERAHGIGE